MAEKKYDLLLGPRRNSSEKIRHQPWYRERLNTKYDHKNNPLIASSWTFLKGGLDDFRDGKPPSANSSLIKGNQGIMPSLFRSDALEGQKPKQKIRKKLNKYDVIYAKTLPGQEKRKQRVADVEQNLLNHPLALYPHIEDSVPLDLFEDIVDLLDPSMTLTEEANYDEESTTPITDILSENSICSGVEGSHVSLSREVCSGYNNAMKVVHQKPRKKIMEEEQKENRTNLKKSQTPQLTKIEHVTNDFCNWVRGLGGESNNIEETTINSLFASGYETKPTLSVPVHVVELTNVPPELRADGHSPHPDETTIQENEELSYTPSWVKVKYGAWYLDPITWKKRPANQPLEDPKDIEGKQMSEARKKSHELDKVLLSLHGAKAFRNFIEKKGTRNPEFLETVSTSNDDGSGNLIDQDVAKRHSTN